MDPCQILTPGVADRYRARFGEDGAFDTTMFSEMATLALMAEALRQDLPVTREDVEAMHMKLYRQPLPESGTPVSPSGYARVTPIETPVAPDPTWMATPPAPDAAPATPTPSERRRTEVEDA